jgi:hypothetical protein
MPTIFCVSGLVSNHRTVPMQYAAYSSRVPQIVVTYPAHEFLAKRTAVSEGATMQLPVYRLRRIPLLRTLVNKGMRKCKRKAGVP